MRLPLYGSLLLAVPILISHGISHAASEQNTPAPGLSAQAIAQYEAILKNLSPETLNSAKHSIWCRSIAAPSPARPNGRN